MIVEYAGEVVEARNDEGIGEDNHDTEVKVSRIVVSMVDERISDVETINVSGWDVQTDSFFITPSPMVTFLFISATRTVMVEVKTFSM